MMLIDYPHSKNIHNLKFVELIFFKIKDLLNKILRFQESFTTCQWGVMYMTFKEIFSFMIQEKNLKIINIFSCNFKLS
jgi:hypothetical protein